MNFFIAILFSSLAIFVNSSQIPCCGVNESFLSCSSNCRAETCDNLNSNTIPDCPTDDCDSGCFCNVGFARNADNVCVDVAECAPKIKAQITCKVNEVFSPCGNTCGQSSCSNPTNLGVICADVCIKGCICKPGYIRDMEGVCIPKSNCPQRKHKCKKNEIFKTCVNPCHESSCEDRSDFLTCDDYCQDGCFCKDGYLRDINLKCVRVLKCQNNNCNRKTEDYICGLSECSPACITGVPKSCSYIKKRCSMGCFCKEGFILDSKYGKCIPQKECDCKS